MSPMRARTLVMLFVGLAVLHHARPAEASFHLMKITEVFAGNAASPNAQFIELQMHANGQNLVNGAVVEVFDASNTLIQAFTFSANVTNAISQDNILIATT